MLIDPHNLDVSQAGELADYVGGGHTMADWLHDQSFRCDCCRDHFDNESDMTDADDFAANEAAVYGALCNDCSRHGRGLRCTFETRREECGL